MIKSLPLHNKRVLVPRSAKEAKSFSHLIEEYGGIPIEIPLIAFRPVKDSPGICKILESLHTYDWIIFTSKVAVETFLTFIREQEQAALPKIAVIGKKTEEVLKANGLKTEFYPSRYVAEIFAEEFHSYVHKGMKILIPKGNLARDYIAASLRSDGAIVDEMIIYENYMPEDSKQRLASMIAAKQLDICLFTSSSTVDHFMDVIRKYKLDHELEGCFIGCIGPATEKKLKSYGLPVHATPKVYTVEEMIKSMIANLEKR